MPSKLLVDVFPLVGLNPMQDVYGCKDAADLEAQGFRVILTGGSQVAYTWATCSCHASRALLPFNPLPPPCQHGPDKAHAPTPTAPPVSPGTKRLSTPPNLKSLAFLHHSAEPHSALLQNSRFLG
ncbi:hypothetical protein CVT26_004566 [Gymnopilus dilepis]|uniref:Uncharacterized protein n=1 Tax=Gymnopilus dilepis TaxID=231916 RepID=A0A409YJA2_9AGAR|nr:hypothetical protein CVT26_004566 [Gymnopilus dilepis]